MKRIVTAGLGASLLLLVAGCGLLDSVQPFDVRAGFTPTALGFEVDDKGEIEVPSHSIVFRSGSGSLGGVITGYEIEYLDASGNPILAGDSRLLSRGSLAHEVPAGIQCEASDPCTATSADASFAAQPSEPLENFISLPGEIAIEQLVNPTTGARGIVTFHATTDNGSDVSFDQEIAVTFPVAP
ncbi:MAG: hypothetical protein WD336_08190 [Trueperaceae bacterium]